jgi:hypothetical protein
MQWQLKTMNNINENNNNGRKSINVNGSIISYTKSANVANQLMASAYNI